MDVGRLAARAVIGGLFIGHGTQKLFGWFGGPGMEGTEQMMGALEMRPTRPNALAAGLSESVGGALLVLGAATPAAAAGLIGTMTTAIHKVHQANGPWVAQGGWEYNAVLIAALTALVDAGPGDASVDALVGREEWGPAWAVGGLCVGVAASAAAVTLGRRGGSAQDATPSPESDVVQAVEEQVGRELQPTPQRRLGAHQIHSNLIRDDVLAAWPPTGWGRLPSERVDVRRSGGQQLLEDGLQVSGAEPRDRLLELGNHVGLIAPGLVGTLVAHHGRTLSASRTTRSVALPGRRRAWPGSVRRCASQRQRSDPSAPSTPSRRRCRP